MTPRAHGPDRRRAAAFAALLLAATTAPAQPVELRQGSEIGAGTAFRRGELCMVLTAAHVVKDPLAEVQVLDRTGARATAQVTYANTELDLALVTLPPQHAVACRQSWPDAGWMATAPWNVRTQLEMQRHYPDGRETVLVLRWAGGTPNSLTLARTDRMEVRESDSGSAVMLGDRLAGIVKEVDTARDRVEVLRFDVIDRLVGERFRGRGGAAAIAFEGVLFQNRRQPTWTEYAASWLTQGAQRPLVAPGDPQARCTLRAKVLSWGQGSVPNPEHQRARDALAGCATNPINRLSKTLVKMCQDNAQATLRNAPSMLRRHAVQISVEAQPKAGPATSLLRQIEHTEAPARGGTRAESELEVMQAAFSSVAQELFAAGACD